MGIATLHGQLVLTAIFLGTFLTFGMGFLPSLGSIRGCCRRETNAWCHCKPRSPRENFQKLAALGGTNSISVSKSNDENLFRTTFRVFVIQNERRTACTVLSIYRKNWRTEVDYSVEYLLFSPHLYWQNASFR